MTYIGSSVRPIDWDARSRGAVDYVADLPRTDHLFAAVLRSPHPLARIVAIETAFAERMPGVGAVITSADFRPGVRYLHRGAPLDDRPPLADGIVRHVGQEIAAVAADTYEQALAACAAIAVRYKVLKAPVTPQQALAPGAFGLHDRSSGERNVAVRFAGDWGDPEAGRKRSTVIVAGSFVYPSLSHAVMEPNITLAQWDEDRSRVELWTSTQAPWFITKEVAHVLGIDQDDVICREVAVGGGFGSKSKISEHETLAAALSRKALRPVLLAQTREEEFASNKVRHRFETTITTGADADGVLQYCDAQILTDNGSYNHTGPSVMRVGVITLGSLYPMAGVRFDARLVDTATQPGGSFRGYGTPQVSLASEAQVDEIADKLDIDPIEIRLRNLPEAGTTTLAGYQLSTVALRECLETVRRELTWDDRRHPTGTQRGRWRRGLGVAAGSHGSGAYAYPNANRSDAAIDVFADGRVRVRFGGADAGTGQRTILAQIAADTLGVAIENVEVLSIDSEETPFDLGAWSSRGTHMTGMSVGKAAREVVELLRDSASKILGVPPGELELARGRISGPDGNGVPIGAAALDADGAATDGLFHETTYLLEGTEPILPDRNTSNLSPTYSFAAHGVEVLVDTYTGKVEIVDYVAAHDVGFAINPTLVEGQIIGGAVMGIGGALGEETLREGGTVVNSAYVNYAMPRNADVPTIRPFLVGSPDAKGPFGAKSVGEISIVPPAAAIANAVANALGVRITELPITPDKVVAAVAASQGRSRRIHKGLRVGLRWNAMLRGLYPLGLHHVLHTWGTRLGRGVGHHTAEEAMSRIVRRPDTLDELRRQVASGAVPVGGSSDAMVAHRRRPQMPLVLASVGGVDELTRIRFMDDGRCEIGAGVTLSVVERESEMLSLLAQAVATIASPQIRNSATVGGNLLQEKRCHFFRNGFPCYKRNGVTSPCYAVMGEHRFGHAAIGGHRCQAVTPSDLASAFIALDARVRLIRGDRTRELAMSDFLVGPGETGIGDGEVLTAVIVPAAAVGRVGVFEKLALYTGDFAMVSATVSAVPGRTGALEDWRVVLGAISPRPLRLSRVENCLQGVSPATIADMTDMVREQCDAELNQIADPLPGTVWKLDAAAGLVATAVAKMSAQ
ncbi:MAG TPA: molybdopterin cofactor-binding domain-containing protein [Williamsia sp.]